MAGKARTEPTHEDVLGAWIERDLTEAAELGHVLPAFEVDDALAQVGEVLALGRVPVLVGAPGVGKTAVVLELVRRAQRGGGPPALAGRRVVQVSLARRAAAQKDAREMGGAFEALCAALQAQDGAVVPFFRDLHVAYAYGIGPLLVGFAWKFSGALLAEADADGLDQLVEEAPDLAQHLVPVHVEEPDDARTRRILAAWAGEQERRYGTGYAPEALERALQLSNRFLARERLPRRVLSILAQAGSFATEGQPVAPGTVVERFCRQQRIPRSLVDPDAPLDLGAVEATFAREVLGQPEATSAAVNVISLIKAGLADARRPFGAFLFVGPTGVGKTHVAQLLAEALFGARDRLVRINMADLQDEAAEHELFGWPNGHPPARERGVLAQRLQRRSFGVLLLDEFEKAHARVHDRFLQLLDEGCFINGKGETISCRSMIIVATSNVGADVWRTLGLGFRADDAEDRPRLREVDRRLQQTFRFELLNRFDRIVHFQPLSRTDMRAIARRELESLGLRPGFVNAGLVLDADESVLDWLVVRGHDPEHGARFLRRVLERHVTSAIAAALVRGGVPAGGRIVVTVRGGRVVALAESRATTPAAAREVVQLPRGTRTRSKSLDARGLVAQAELLVQGAQAPAAVLASARAEHAALLARMNAPGFWEQPEQRVEVVERYRTLDVEIQAAERHASALRELAAVGEDDLASLAARRSFAGAVERAARALADWTSRLELRGGAATWLVVGPASALRPDPGWIADVAAMELAWCGRLELRADIVAQQGLDTDLTRVVLAVEGPGAAALLAPEQGVHRRLRSGERDARARVVLVAQSETLGVHWPETRRMRAAEGLNGLRLVARGRVERAGEGDLIELLGADAATLGHVLADLAGAWSSPGASDAAPVARTYTEGSGPVRDSRTGAVLPRLKDALRGELDVFLEAWRQRGTQEQAGGTE